MAFARLSRLLSAAAFLAGGNIAYAAVLPTSQPPQVHNGTANQEQPDIQSLGDLYLFTCFATVIQGLANQGEKACSQAIALDPGKTDAYELRGYAYLLQHRFERAAADFKLVLQSRPHNPDDLAGYGRALSGLGRFDAAVTEFSAAVAGAPKDAPIRSGLCWARGGTGKNLGQALADCNAALRLNPRLASALDSRGMVELRMNRYPAAIADYTAALAADPDQASALFGRGLAYLWQGQTPVGRGDIVAARKLDPEIDSLFVTLGVLPQQCGEGKPHCPAGLPALNPATGYQTVVMNYPEERDVAAMEAGRLDIMVDQMALLLKQPNPHQDNDLASSADLPARLTRTAAQFNALLPSACHGGRLPAKLCVPWHPTWAGRTTADPISAVNEAYLHIRPVWAALCSGRKKDCSIE